VGEGLGCLGEDQEMRADECFDLEASSERDYPERKNVVSDGI